MSPGIPPTTLAYSAKVKSKFRTRDGLMMLGVLALLAVVMIFFVIFANPDW